MKEIFNTYQEKLYPYAYNILGSTEDAKDVVQEVITNYISTSKDEIDNEMGYLIKGVINRSINIKKRNQKKVGNSIWLPEPVATEKADSNLHLQEILSYSMLILLENLTPKERAVFILKEAFGYTHNEIAEVFSISIENSRKLLSRARQALENADKNLRPLISEELLQDYIKYIKEGNVQELEKLLADDIQVKTDGGKVAIVSELTVGIKATIKLLTYVYDTYQQKLSIVIKTVNHQQALLFYNSTQFINCQVFEFDSSTSKIKSIYSIVDPEKLENGINS